MQLHLIVGSALVAFAFGANYAGHKVYTITPQTQSQTDFFEVLSANSNFDFWTAVNKVGKPITIKVSPKGQGPLDAYLRIHDIPYDIIIDDVQKAIEKEHIVNQAHAEARKSNPNARISFDQYYRHDEILAYLDQVEEEHPQLVEVISLGESFEGRKINGVRISTGPTNPPKPIIFVDAGIHAREWIAPATALYIINQLVENTENSNLTYSVDWIVVPSLNPDGYEYTWTDDRLWRKTRSTGSICDGCDANRNFGFHWMENGASAFECSETFAGAVAFSEIEAQNLRNFLNVTQNIAAYLTLHSYGQYLLYPYGYADVLAENWEELDDLGNRVNDAIYKVAGTNYTVGSSTRVLYPAAGASDDWARGAANIEIVYTIELPGGGSYGFNLPPSRISAVVQETWEGFLVFHEYVATTRTKTQH